MLGGIGYAIYNAAVAKANSISLMIDGQFIDIGDVVKDYDKIADGEAVQLPDTDTALAELGFTKEGHQFKGWSTDSKGNKMIQYNIIIKGQSPRTLYLQWEKIPYKVYIISLGKEYAKNFDFQGYDNYDRYNQISITGDATPETVLFGELTLDSFQSGDSDDAGYVAAWVKWIGDGEYVKDDNGNAVYYTGRQMITESCVFVRLEMPKKYDVFYKYYDEDNEEQILGQKQLVFNKSGDTIISNDINYGLDGYSVGDFYLKNSSNQTFNLNRSQLIDESILNFIGVKEKEIDCYISYNAKLFDIRLVGYDEKLDENGNPVYTEIETNNAVDISLNYQLLYYSNVKSFLTGVLDDGDALEREYLIFRKFVYKDTCEEVGNTDVMPYAHADSLRPITAGNPLVIMVVYEIKEYNVNLYLQLKTEKVTLSSYKYRYGTEYNFDEDFVDFDTAKEEKMNTAHYYVDEFAFKNYVVQQEGYDDIITNSLAELKNVNSLKKIEDVVNITIKTDKVRFFLELINKGSGSLNKVEQRLEIKFDLQGDSYYYNPEMPSILKYSISSVPNPYYSGTLDGLSNNRYTFGGWLCEDKETFGEYSYVDDDFKFNQSDITDDVRAVAEWFTKDIEGDAFSDLIGGKKWTYKINSDGNTATIVCYNSNAQKIVIPDTVSVGGRMYTVTEVGDGTTCVVGASNSGIKKVLIPSTVTKINAYAFSCLYTGLEVLIQEGGGAVTIGAHAFGAKYNASSNEFSHYSGVTSVCLPRNVTEIEEGAFACNTNLANITINSLNSNYFVTTIKDTVYTNQNGQTVAVELQGQVLYKNIGNGNNLELVHYCGQNKLESFEISEKVTKVCNYAFALCKNYNNASLYKITIKNTNSLKEIGDYAFAFNANLQQVLLPNLSHLETIGTHVFDSSFTSKPAGTPADPFENLAFKIVAFDFNNLQEIPEYMFNGTNNLQGIDFINNGYVNTIGERAFYDFGIDYLQTGSCKQYYTYERIFIDVQSYLYTYNRTVSASDPSDVKKAFKDYLQSYIVLSTLKYVGAYAFDTNVSGSSGSLLTIYTNIRDDENFIAKGDGDAQNAFLGVNAFGGDAKNKIYSLSQLDPDRPVTKNGINVDRNTITKLNFSNVTVSLNSFEVILMDMGIKFTDCVFNSSVGAIFKDFTIRDTLFTPGEERVYIPRFFFEVEYTSESNIHALEQNTFLGLNISKACVFKLLINSSIDDFTLKARSVQNITCNAMEIINVSNVDNTAFSKAEEAGLTSPSAITIEFFDCSFTLTDNSSVYRDMLFYNLIDLEEIHFTNCVYIESELFNSSGDKILSHGIKNVRCPDGNCERVIHDAGQAGQKIIEVYITQSV